MPDAIAREAITGLVLAGGQGRRMGGQDKGLLTLHGQALAARALQRLAPQVGPTAVSANRHLADYQALGVPVWSDTLPDQPGPLAGLLTGMTHARLVEKIIIELRSRVYAKLQRLSFRFYDSNETGSMINRVSGDVQGVRGFLDLAMIQIIILMFSMTLYLGYMLRMNWKLTLVCLSTTPVLHSRPGSTMSSSTPPAGSVVSSSSGAGGVPAAKAVANRRLVNMLTSGSHGLSPPARGSAKEADRSRPTVTGS